MAAASPTPMPAGPVRRTSQRQALRRPNSRQALHRSGSQAGLAADAATSAASSANQSHQYHDDSSDDEIPVPMKLSALTKALLDDGAPERSAVAPSGPSPPRTRRQASVRQASQAAAVESRRHLRSGSVQATDNKASRPPSPQRSRESSPVRKRVVRLSNTPQSLNQLPPGHKRSTSTSRGGPQRPQPPSRASSQDPVGDEKSELREDVNTPGQAGRVVRIASGSSANRSRVGSSGLSSGRSNIDRSAVDRSALEADYDQSEAPDTAARNSSAPASHGSISRHPTSVRRHADGDVNLQGSMRVKRVGKIPGSFLSGPARRARRRHSGEDGEDAADGENQHQEWPEGGDDEAPQSHGIRDFNSGSPIGGGAAARASHRRMASNAEPAEPPTVSPVPSPRGLPVHSARKSGHEEPKIWVPRPEVPSAYDQENQVLPSQKRSKPAEANVLDSARRKPAAAEVRVDKAASPERKPLATIAQNTPHRNAPPPPPKMSVLEAATTTTGAATTTQAKQRRNVLKVNGQCYTRLACLGRGGSGKVYSVTAENGHMFALKRVSLDNADESQIKGYLGEIELLQKLSTARLVVNLHQHEINREKNVLSLVMEMGEADFDSVMRGRFKAENAKLDPVFVRYHWKQMLECVKAVHEFDIVHSDLKPQNFVLVKGELKLIDFGIANAIQTDETVNVHRDANVGTPNYMSPESLMDCNPRGARVAGRSRLMKLGKPSDVWSLGCILYQMVYGVAPFGHIVNHMARCQAIINWDHAIEFPSRAIGGVPVPPSLIRTMKRCLNRDQHMRPTCEELLHTTDPFLYPIELGDRALPVDEELVGKIIQSVVSRCRERMPTESESASVWPQAYWASIKRAVASRTPRGE